MNKKVMMVSAVLFSMLLTAACSNDQADPPAENPPAVVDNEGKDQTEPSEDEPSTDQAQEEKEPAANTDVKPIGEPAAVGDTIDYHGTAITLNSVRDSEGDEYLKPQAGHTFKVVDITVKNNGQEPLVISSALSFSMTDSNDLNYTVPITDDVKMLDGTIAPGRELKGEIPYEVKEDVQGLQLSYGDPMKEGRAIWAVE